jgi:DNA (cytosine-5)-methyltransferase 1
MTDPIRLATVFSGIGAPEFALKRLGIDYEIVFACDNGELPLSESDESIRERLASVSSDDERKEFLDSVVLGRKVNFVKKTYLANYDISDRHYHSDVRFLDGQPYRGKVDLFIGGSPCQSFTLLGYQKGLDEARGTLFYDFARLVRDVRPKAFIYENVQGLLKHDHGRTWKVVRSVFDSLGYHLSARVLDASEYGIPQRRRRIFVVGFRDEAPDFAFPAPRPLAFTLQDFLEDNTAFGGFRSKAGKIVLKKKPGSVDAKYFLSDKILPGIMCEGTGGFSMNPEIDLPVARPLMSSMHKMHRAGEDNYVTTNGRIRRLTPRECLRLMGFTDDFKIVVSDTQMYRQAGNSVVVDVLAALISEVLKYL